MSNVKISVAMIAYNQEKFVRQAVESVLNQKTKIPFEIVIGEDCSTDKTRQICIEYQNKYPNMIKLLLHEKNVGAKENTRRVFDNCSGEYMAFLECDDYWIDDTKLQKQIDFLETHNNYVAVVHNSYLLDYQTKKKERFSKKHMNGEISIKKVIIWDGVFHISSMVARAAYIKNRVHFEYSEGIIGDYPVALWLAIKGKIYFMKDIMSVYRYLTPGSWSEGALMDSRNQEVLEILDKFSQYTNNEYDKYVTRRKDFMLIGRYLLQNDVRNLKKIGIARILSIYRWDKALYIMLFIISEKFRKYVISGRKEEGNRYDSKINKEMY